MHEKFSFSNKKKEKLKISRKSECKVLVTLCDSHVMALRCHLLTPQQLIATHMSYSKLHQIVSAANKATGLPLPDTKMKVKRMVVITCNDDPRSRAVIRAGGN